MSSSYRELMERTSLFEIMMNIRSGLLSHLDPDSIKTVYGADYLMMYFKIKKVAYSIKIKAEEMKRENDEKSD